MVIMKEKKVVIIMRYYLGCPVKLLVKYENKTILQLHAFKTNMH